MADERNSENADSASAPVIPKKEQWKYEDPNKDPGRKGLLLSNEIEMFCNEGLLIDEHYDRRHLRPAAYTLRIGPDYVDGTGKRAQLRERESFYLEPNAIAYVTTLESFNLPYYIVARFNLRVKWVYQGILLGTGPQVEPGYRGVLSCPLFNLTDKAMKITYEQEFATIDFERTSDFCPGKSWNWIREQIRNSQDVDKLEEVVSDGRRFLLFKQRPYPALEHHPDRDIVSSLLQLSNEVKTWRYIGVGIVIAFFALAITLLNFQTNLYRDLRTQGSQLGDVKQTSSGVDVKQNELQSQLIEARQQLRDLETRTRALEQARPGNR